MIYFLQPSDGGPVKIGHTANLAVRHKALENHYGIRLVLLAKMEGGRDLEQAIHKKFTHLRLPNPTRWGIGIEQFQPSPELMEFIGCPSLVGTDPVSPMLVKTPKPRVKNVPAPDGSAVGPLLRHNLGRLAIGLDSAEIAKLIEKKTGKKISRQRISAILNAVRVNHETLELIAKGLGVKVEELTRKPKGK